MINIKAVAAIQTPTTNVTFTEFSYVYYGYGVDDDD